jgi:hypothetical protein
MTLSPKAAFAFVLPHFGQRRRAGSAFIAALIMAAALFCWVLFIVGSGAGVYCSGRRSRAHDLGR